MSKVKPPSRNRPMRPPRCSFFSKTSTPKPMSLSRIAAASPPMPAPTMATRFVAKKPPLLCPSCLSGYIHEYTREMLTRSAKAPGKGAHTWMTEATTKAAVLAKRGAARTRAEHPWIYRLLRAEADGIPGLVADRYGDYFALQVGSAAVERRLAPLVAVFEDLFASAGVLLRDDTPVRWREGLARRVEILSGRIPESVIVCGGPVPHSVRPWAGQKTRGFLDHPGILTIPATHYLKCAVLECL